MLRSEQRALVEDRTTGARLLAREASARTLHGAAPVLIVADEPAQWLGTQREAIYSALRSRLGKVPGARLVAIGTRSDDPSHWFSRLLQRNGTTYAADPEADPYDPATWHAANPSLAHFPTLYAVYEREAAEAAADPSLLQGVFDGIPVMIVVLDGDGEVQLVNPELSRMLGYDLDRWHAGDVLEALLPDDGDRERFATLMRTSPQPWLELSMQPRTGDSLATSWCSVPFVDGVICIGQDVTVRQKAEWLQKQVERTERLAGIGQLAAGIAHEVNNPATYVLTNLEILQDLLGTLEDFVDAASRDAILSARAEAMREQVGEMKGMVRDNLDGMLRIRKIVRDLSTFSRFRQEEIEWVELGEVVDAACRLVSTEIRHRARLVRSPVEVPRIAADRGKLVQMLVNLLVNAAHAIEAGDAAHNEVRVSAREGAEGSVLLTVSDTGRGIEPELVERVFEPFFTTKPRGVGTGLGLSLCAQIARMHHATIAVDSAPGRGTRFTVSFPRDTGLQPSPAEVTPAPVKAASGVSSTVLVVDDEPAILKAYRRVLESEHEVIVAGSGQEALDLLLGDGATAFDVILCDLMMPEVDGPMLYQTVRKRAPHLLSRIVFFSGGAFTTRARELVSAIPNMVLEKPIEQHVLRRVVAELSAARRG